MHIGLIGGIGVAATVALLPAVDGGGGGAGPQVDLTIVHGDIRS